MKFQPHERIFSIFLHPATLVKWACIQRNWYNGAVSGNSTNIYSKTYRSRILTTYLAIMKNERYKLGNPTETRTIQSRTQIATQNSELGSNDSTGIRLPKSLSTAAADMPRRSGYPQGSGEVLERDRGSQSPVSFQPPPRGANKIYRSDEVFLIEKSQN